MMPLAETNLPMFQACVKGHHGIHYSVESITRDEKTSRLTESTIDRRFFQMMFGDIPMPLDGKLPHWALVEVLVCAMQGCDTNVHVKGFTVTVNGSIFGKVDTSLAYRCPHKNCLVCIGCAEMSLEKGGDSCPACQGAMPLVDRKSAVKSAAALTKSMLSLLGPDANTVGSKRARDQVGAEDVMEEVELEEDDTEEDLLALEGLANETVYEVVKSFPPNLIDPEKVWPLEAAFYEKLRNLYRPDIMLLGDKYSLYFSVVRGWTRTLPLHILIGDKYLTAILLPDPLSFFCFVEKESTEAAFAIKAMKFTFRGEVACQGARRIFTGKNETLKKANPTGQFPQAFTMQFPDGTPLRTADGKLRKEFITVPFLSFGAYLPCFLHTCVCLFCL